MTQENNRNAGQGNQAGQSGRDTNSGRENQNMGGRSEDRQTDYQNNDRAGGNAGNYSSRRDGSEESYDSQASDADFNADDESMGTDLSDDNGQRNAGGRYDRQNDQRNQSL